MISVRIACACHPTRLRDGRNPARIDYPEMRKNFSRLILAILAISSSALVSCDGAKGVVAKLAKLKSEVRSSSGGAGSGPHSSDQISELNKSGYPGFIARKDALVIVDFHAEWCPPCKKLGPVLEKATEAHPGVVYLGKVDVDKASDLAQENKVSSIPDVRIFRNGVEVDRFVGFPGEAAVLAKIDSLSKGIQAAPAPPSGQTAAITAKPEPKIKPFEKGWLPPGISRQGETRPKPTEPGPSAQR